MEYLTYQGIVYGRNPNGKSRAGRVYWSAQRGSGGSLLHRDIYESEVGPIPDGWHIHHIDEDPFNNDPSNLVALSPLDHARVHPGAIDRTSSEWLVHLAEIRILAAEWHGSPEGLEWHKEHGARTWDGREADEGTCQVCGQPMDVWFEDKRFCSRTCINRFHEKEKTYYQDATCPICGAIFKRRYSRTQTCSRKCGAQLRKGPDMG